MDWSGPGGPQGPQPSLVDQQCSGPPWTTLRHFPDGEKYVRVDKTRRTTGNNVLGTLRGTKYLQTGGSELGCWNKRCQRCVWALAKHD